MVLLVMVEMMVTWDGGDGIMVMVLEVMVGCGDVILTIMIEVNTIPRPIANPTPTKTPFHVASPAPGWFTGDIASEVVVGMLIKVPCVDDVMADVMGDIMADVISNIVADVMADVMAGIVTGIVLDTRPGALSAEAVGSSVEAVGP